MRPLLLILVLALFASACNTNIKIADAPFTLDSLMMYDYNGLEKLFSADQLKDSIAQDTSGQAVRFTLLMQGMPSSVRLQWTDTTRSMIAFASIFGKASAWKTRDSVTVGITVTQLEKLNGVPFYFYNNTPEANNSNDGTQPPSQPGYVMVWTTDANSESKLAGHVYAVRLDASIKPAADSQNNNILSSNSPDAIASNPIVTEVTLSMRTTNPELIIETVLFASEAGAPSEIPHAVLRGGRQDPRVDSINAIIKRYFMIESFDSQAAENFPWSEVTFETEMDDQTIALHIKGSYMGSYSSEIDEYIFIDKGGYKMESKPIPFHSLFAYDQYFRFLDKYWSTSCKAKMKEAEVCADMLPSCNCYNLDVRVVDNNIKLYVNSDCYPHVAAACTPQLEMTVPLDDLEKYLSDFGKQIVFDRDYYNQSALQQFNIVNQVKYNMPAVFFLRFDITYADGQSGPDEAKMGFQLLPSDDPFNGDIVGWLSFDNIEQEPIKLTGKFVEGGTLELWDPQESIALKFPLRWVPTDDYGYEGYFEGGTNTETYNFIASLYVNTAAFGERGD